MPVSPLPLDYIGEDEIADSLDALPKASATVLAPVAPISAATVVHLSDIQPQTSVSPSIPVIIDGDRSLKLDALDEADLNKKLSLFT